MTTVEEKLEQLGLVLPADYAGKRSFVPVRVVGNIAYVSGHGPQTPDGRIAEPLGAVGANVTVEQGYEAAKLTALSILATLKRELGELDRVRTWVKLLGMVNTAPGFSEQPSVINGASDLILELYGPERGAHARSAVGMAGLPWNIPVEIEAIVEIDAES